MHLCITSQEGSSPSLTPGCSLQQCQVRKGIVKATKQLSDILPNSSSCQKNYMLCQEEITEEQTGICHKWQRPQVAHRSRNYLSQERGNGGVRTNTSVFSFKAPSG